MTRKEMGSEARIVWTRLCTCQSTWGEKESEWERGRKMMCVSKRNAIWANAPETEGRGASSYVPRSGGLPEQGRLSQHCLASPREAAKWRAISVRSLQLCPCLWRYEEELTTGPRWAVWVAEGKRLVMVICAWQCLTTDYFMRWERKKWETHWTWWCAPLLPALGRSRGSSVGSRTVWST